MTASVHQSGQYDEVGLILGSLRNVSSHTTVLGGTHVTTRYQHGVLRMSRDDAVLLQRELLQALASHGWRPDVSGSATDLGDA